MRPWTDDRHIIGKRIPPVRCLVTLSPTIDIAFGATGFRSSLCPEKTQLCATSCTKPLAFAEELGETCSHSRCLELQRLAGFLVLLCVHVSKLLQGGTSHGGLAKTMGR
jgi:hypothetical protein